MQLGRNPKVTVTLQSDCHLVILENLMSLFIECVENDVTLGEICNTLRGVWGEYVAEGV